MEDETGPSSKESPNLLSEDSLEEEELKEFHSKFTKLSEKFYKVS